MSAGGQAWQGDDHGHGYDSAETHQGEPGTHSDSSTWKRCADEGEWCRSRAVDQSQHDEGQGECTHAGGATREAVDDRDPRRIVEAPGEDDTGEGCSAVAGGERQRRWALFDAEQPSPAQCLESLGADEEQPCRHKHPGVATRKRPGGRREVAGGQQQERGCNRTVSGRECPAPLSRPTKARERPDH